MVCGVCDDATPLEDKPLPGQLVVCAFCKSVSRVDPVPPATIGSVHVSGLVRWHVLEAHELAVLPVAERVALERDGHT
jgi:hypothetical protein